MTSPSRSFPMQEEIRKQLEYIQHAKVGDPKTPFAALSVSNREGTKELNNLMELDENVAAIYKSMSFYFSRDNVGLPGIALLFKILSQVELNDIWFYANEMTKRGEHPEVRGTEEPPKEWHKGHEKSDVLYAFEKTLAMGKAQSDQINRVYRAAADAADPHLACIMEKAIGQHSEKVKCMCHWVASLKVTSHDKHAIKQFDRCLPKEIEDLACAAGIEAALPARLNMGTVARAFVRLNKTMEKQQWEIDEKDLVRREIWQKVK